MEYGALALLAYLLGAIPTGFLVGKAAGNVDVRAYGSGRIGATNVYRTLGLGPFILVFCIDFAKGFFPVWFAGQLLGTPAAQVTAALATLIGHNWSVFIGFTGGRGVATGIGGLYAIAPQIAAVTTIATVLVILASRYASLGALVGCSVAVPFALTAVAFGWERPHVLLYVLSGAVIVVYQHRDNIQRLLTGTERRLGDAGDPKA